MLWAIFFVVAYKFSSLPFIAAVRHVIYNVGSSDRHISYAKSPRIRAGYFGAHLLSIHLCFSSVGPRQPAHARICPSLTLWVTEISWLRGEDSSLSGKFSRLRGWGSGHVKHEASERAAGKHEAYSRATLANWLPTPWHKHEVWYAWILTRKEKKIEDKKVLLTWMFRHLGMRTGHFGPIYCQFISVFCSVGPRQPDLSISPSLTDWHSLSLSLSLFVYIFYSYRFQIKFNYSKIWHINQRLNHCEG